MICLLYYRFSASPVLSTKVATKADEVRTIFLPEYYFWSNTLP
jgi:hypothetical protein